MSKKSTSTISWKRLRKPAETTTATFLQGQSGKSSTLANQSWYSRARASAKRPINAVWRCCRFPSNETMEASPTRLRMAVAPATERFFHHALLGRQSQSSQADGSVAVELSPDLQPADWEVFFFFFFFLGGGAFFPAWGAAVNVSRSQAAAGLLA